MAAAAAAVTVTTEKKSRSTNRWVLNPSVPFLIAKPLEHDVYLIIKRHIYKLHHQTHCITNNITIDHIVHNAHIKL
jgi:hypothetical protein